jgi:hypothetical protein
MQIPFDQYTHGDEDEDWGRGDRRKECAVTVLVAALLVPVLTLLPGYSLLPSRYPRRLRLPFVIFASVAVTSVVGLALMLAGHFSVPLLAALEAPLLLLRRRARDWPVLGLAHHVPALLLMVVVAIFAVRPSKR